jgi:phage portal protein BeeE
MAKRKLDFTGLSARWADQLQAIPAPTILDLVREYRGLAGACCNFNANAVTNTELKLYKGENQEVKTHPFLDLWEKPNKYMPGPQFLKMTQLYLELTGKCYWRLVPGVISPVEEVYVLPPQQVSNIIEDRKIIGYKYLEDTLTLKEIIPIYVACPLNPYGNGTGPTEIAWQFIKLFSADTSMMYNLLVKSGRPGALISPEGQQGIISPSLSQRLSVWWNSFTGRNSGDVAISPLPLKVDLLNVSSKEFEGSARAAALKTLILNCYDIPPALFDSMASRAELDAAMVQHARLAIDPRTTLLAGVINHNLVNLFDDSLHVEFDWALPEDEKDEPKPDGSEPKIPTDVGEGDANT